MGARGGGGRQVFHRHVAQIGPDEGCWHWAEAGALPCQVFLLYFLGRLLGSQWKRPLRGAQGSAEEDTGADSCSAKGTQGLFPPVQKCISKSGGQGAAAVCPPSVGTRGRCRSGEVSRGLLSSVLQMLQACWAPGPGSS